MPKIKLAYHKNLHWTLSSRIDLLAVCRSRIKEPYCKMRRTRAQYNVLIELCRVNSLADRITNARTFNKLEHIISL